MKRKKVKVFAVCVLAMIICLQQCLPAFAETHFYDVERTENNFLKAWEKTVTYKLVSNEKEIGIMVFGYDTFLVKEDYTWTKGYECNTTAGVFRNGTDTSYQTGKNAAIGVFSKIEVEHKGSYVAYRITFSATYPTNGYITSSKENSAVK